MNTQLPEYLRDVLKDQKEEEDLKIPFYGFTASEIAEQEEALAIENGINYENSHIAKSSYSTRFLTKETLSIMEESGRQEKAGINSWLDLQPFGPGVSNPHQDRAIKFIKEFGYARTTRGKRPSLIYKNIISNLIQLRGDDLPDILKRILKQMNLDPNYFVEQRLDYKY